MAEATTNDPTPSDTVASDAVSLGFIGLGRWGHMLAEAAQRSGRARVAAGFTRTPETRAAFAEAFDCADAVSVEDILASNVDGVVIATPHSTHRAYIEAAAAAGKHVLVEKPLTLTVADGRAAIAAAADAGVVLQVGHQRRKLAAVRALKGLVDDGVLGPIQLLEANLSVPAGLDPSTDWRTDPGERPLGGMTGLGVHMVDTLAHLAGPARRVTAMTAQTLGRSRIDDVTTLLIEYETGPLGYVGTALVTPKIATVAVYGTDAAAWSEEDGLRLFRQSTGETSRTELSLEPADALADQLTEFARAIRGETTPQVTGEEALETVAVLEAAVLSAERGAAVNVDEVRG